MPDIEVTVPTGRVNVVGQVPIFYKSEACSEVLSHARTVWKVSYADDPLFLNPIVELDTSDPAKLRAVTLEAVFDVGREIIAQAFTFDNCGCALEAQTSGTIPAGICPPVFVCPEPSGEAEWTKIAQVEAIWEGGCLSLRLCPPEELVFGPIPTGTLELTGSAPEFSTSEIIIPTGKIDVKGFAPTFSTNELIIPTGSLTLQGFAPGVEISEDFELEIPTGSMALTGFAPSVEAGIVVSIPTGSLGITGFAPIVPLNDLMIPIPSGSLSLISSPPLVSPGGEVTPFFADGFESGGLDHTEGGFAWLSTTNVGVFDMMADVGVPALMGSQACRFRLPGKPVGEDSWAELRFTLGQDLTEIWIEYWLYIPLNYFHRAGPGPDNNKFFRLWADDVDFSLTTELNLAADVAGDSGMKRFLAGTRGALGTITSCCATEEPYKSARESTPNVVGAGLMIEPGQWTRIRHHFRSASARDAIDGVAEWFAGDTLVKQLYWDFWANVGEDGGNPGQPAYVNRGYVLGWANSGFDVETKLWVDGFKVYNAYPGWGDVL